MGQHWSRCHDWLENAFETYVMSNLSIKKAVFPKQIWRAGARNYIPHYLWGVIVSLFPLPACGSGVGGLSGKGILNTFRPSFQKLWLTQSQHRIWNSYKVRLDKICLINHLLFLLHFLLCSLVLSVRHALLAPVPLVRHFCFFKMWTPLSIRHGAHKPTKDSCSHC